MRILALDHGSARVGVAICDPTETLARPLGIVAPDEHEAVSAIISDEGVELVVVGLPVSLDGSEGEQAGAARAYVEALAGVVPVPVETYDERLTTRLAERSARGGATGAPDALAAAHLLESYMQMRAGAARKATEST